MNNKSVNQFARMTGFLAPGPNYNDRVLRGIILKLCQWLHRVQHILFEWKIHSACLDEFVIILPSFHDVLHVCYVAAYIILES